MVAVVGPTASGKTQLAVQLAERLNGELLSADSRQVFRGNDIGTNKPDAAELRGIPCHVIGVVNLGEPFTVAAYRGLALAAIAEIRRRHRLPILQGGTGLYVRAVLDGWNLADAPPNPAVRAALEERLVLEGVDVLVEELHAIDPTAAARAERNPRRVIRALEIHAVTGLPPSAARRASPPPWSSVVIGLDLPLSEIDRRIEARVDRMLRSGWIDEVQRIRAHFPQADLGVLGHGYVELASVIDGESPLERARASIIRQIRQYARRQLTWFRADHRVRWIAPAVEEAFKQVRVAMMALEAS